MRALHTAPAGAGLRSLLAGWLAAALQLAAAPVLAAEPAGQLLYVSNRSGSAQIHRMAADGRGDRALTAGPEENAEPAWSHDGSRVAFTSYRDGNAEIYVMDADGGQLRRLSTHPQADSAPAWLPDGRIVFRSMRSGWANFYTVAADGSGLAPLTSTPSDKGAPLPSPDGRWVAWIGHGELGRTDLFAVATAGGEVVNLTGAWSTSQKLAPAWSPDGRRLLYGQYKDGRIGLHSIALDGSPPRPIAESPYANSSASWSPDGRRIVFVSSREGTRMDMARGDIYVMNADGSDASNLTRHPGEDNYPEWSADGRTIYFVSLRDGSAQIYAVPATGGPAQRLTQDSAYDLWVRPQPAAPATARLGRAGTPQTNTP